VTNERATKNFFLVAGIAALLSLLITSLPSAAAQTPGAVSVCSDRVAVQVEPQGQLTFGAFPTPAPECGAGAQSYPLSFTWPSASTSFTTVRIDGSDNTFHEGTVITPPTAINGDTVFMEMGFGEVNVAQLVQITTNPITGLVDAARVSYSVDNVSPNQTPHDVGIRFFVDARVGDSDNPTFFVNNEPVTTETSYFTVPDSFSAQHPTIPTQAAAGTLGSNFGNITPNRFIIANFSSFTSSAWDTTASNQPLGDSAFGVFWETGQLPPGNQATYTTTYGVGPGGQSGGGNPIKGCEDTEQNQCGTTGDDNLSSSDGTVVGGPGDDTITVTVDSTTETLTADGGTGADKIVLNIEDASNLVSVKLNSGDGADRIFVPGHPGMLSPVVKSGGSNDIIRINSVPTAPRRNYLQGTPVGRYSINAGGGNDRVTLGTSNDLIDGAAGDDLLAGAAGLDEIEGGDGNDDMAGGDGADVLHGGDGANDFSGGPGRDTCLSDTRRDKFNSCERLRRNHRRNHMPI
jgi:Ca2+-binding RTX toxin-like protein